MAKFSVGDLVVLKSGSMRMVVEDAHDDETISTVWCNEGVIGRDRFAAALLNKWEHREEGGHRSAPRGGDREGGYKGGRGGEGGGGYRGKGGDDRGGYKGRGDDDRPPRAKTGWDGKPREKKYFRKDD